MHSRRSKAAPAVDTGVSAVEDEVALIPDTPVEVKAPWTAHRYIQWVLHGCACASLVSICFNTPDTFESLKRCKVIYITFAVDVAITGVFFCEMIFKIKRLGFVRPNLKGKEAYLRDHWCRFEMTMVLFLFISIALHTVQMAKFSDKNHRFESFWIGLLRAPRPLIFVRIFRLLLTIKLPTARISQILKRSSQQIYNVTLFFLFFMSFYGILGVQFFGPLQYHCVRNSANASNLTTADLAIPDTQCTPRNQTQHGYVCPENMKCEPVELHYSVVGYTTFANFPISFFSVYNAASQEGWSLVMYDTMDTLASWKSYIYFISLIFFLAWLVKNVFIAVIIETFAEIRVQFQKMWGSKGGSSERPTMTLEKEEDSWKLISLDERKPSGVAPMFVQKMVKSAYFKTVFMFIILADAIVAACRVSYTERVPKTMPQLDAIYYAQVAFTAVFVLEVMLKVWVYGPRVYIRPSRHKWELILAFFSIFNIVPHLYRNVFTYAQVFRISRLIKASPVLEEFCWKIFGPSKKLGSLVLFTMALLIITSGISLQLFCYIKETENNEGSPAYHKQFSNFIEAVESTFQILTGENWLDEMYALMELSYRAATSAHLGEAFSILIAIYFVVIHLGMTTIILSLFVAVILDNLDLDEDIKRVKQLKAREMSTAQQQNLPLRLRVFEKFSNQPQLVSFTKKIGSLFTAPKVRESFMRSFVDCDSVDGANSGLRHRKGRTAICQEPLPDISLLTDKCASRSTKEIFQIDEIHDLISESSKQRSMNSSDPLISKGNATLPTHKSLLSANQGNSSSTLRMGKARTNLNIRNPRTLNNDAAGANKPQRNGGVASPSGQPGSQGSGRANPGDDIDIQILQQKKQQAEIKRTQQESDLRENHPLFDTPLFVVGRESHFREVCKSIVNAKYIGTFVDSTTGQESKTKYKKLAKFLSIVPWLDWFMIFMTLLSCIFMMLEQPDKRITNPSNKDLRAIEYLFIVCMSIEMALKIFANGLLFTPNAVIRDVGGAMDMFIYLTSLLFVAVMLIANPEREGVQLAIPYTGGGHALLILRCMRPLRIFILVPHIRKVVYELVRGFKEILLVFLLLFVLVFVFASYGVQRYGGLLYRCNDPSKNTSGTCRGVFLQEVKVTDMKLPDGEEKVAFLVPRVWSNPHNFNFDNIISAMLALFEVLSLEGWLEIRDTLIDRVGPFETFFVHVFVFIGVLIGLTLFVGVVISNYSQNKGTALLTVDQRRWLDLKGRVNLTPPLHVPPRPDHNRLRAFVFDVTQNKWFKRGIAIIVALNALLLVVPWHSNKNEVKPSSNEQDNYQLTAYALQYAAIGFVCIFVVEVIMKLVALSPKGYWYSRRNRMDLVITSLGVLWAILHFTLRREDDELDLDLQRKLHFNREVVDTFGYIVIILRFCTITGKHATLKMLMLTVVESMWKSFFLIIGMFLLMLFYAYAGVLLFGTVRYGENLNRHANFRTAPKAIALLFRIVTGEDWNKIMHDCMISIPNCYPGKNYWDGDCGHSFLSFLYFGSFYIIITYIMLNLLVAIIMENFSLFYSNEEDALLSYSDIRMYQNTWNNVDIARKGSIPNSKVPELLSQLTGRLKMDVRSVPTKMLFKYLCYEIEYLHGGKTGETTFHDVLLMLSYRSVDIRKSLQLEEFLVREELELTIAEDVAKQMISDWLTRCVLRMRTREQHRIANTPVQEPFYVVTQPEEASPIQEEAAGVDVGGLVSGLGKSRVTRNVSEPAGLQIPKKVVSTLSDPQVKERLERNSLSSRTALSTGMSESMADEKSGNVESWWNEHFSS